MTKPTSRNGRARVASSAKLGMHHANGARSEHVATRCAWARTRDPAAMSPDECIAELGSLLAAANRRLRVRKNQLAGSAVGCPPCVPVNGDGAGPAKESA